MLGFDVMGRRIEKDFQLQYATETKLRKSQQRYTQAQRVANIGSWEWNLVTGDIEWSDEIEPMFGLKRDEFKGSYDAFIEYVHPDDRAKVAEAIEKAIQNPNSHYHSEHRVLASDGTTRWVHETGNVIRNNYGEPKRMFGIVQDITERKCMKAKLFVTEKMTMIAGLAAGVAHEINTLSAAYFNPSRALNRGSPVNFPGTEKLPPSAASTWTISRHILKKKSLISLSRGSNDPRSTPEKL